MQAARYVSFRMHGPTVDNAPGCVDCGNCINSGNAPKLFNLDVNTNWFSKLSLAETAIRRAGVISANCLYFGLPRGNINRRASAKEPLPTCINFVPRTSPVIEPLPTGASMVAVG